MSYLRDRLSPPLESVREVAFTPDLKGLVAWLETQDGARTYNWDSCKHCVAGEFLTAIGRENDRYAFGHAEIIFDNNVARYLEVAFTQPHTFGAALSRARAALEHS